MGQESASFAHNQTEINQLWKDVKHTFINEMGSLPSLPSNNNEKQNQIYRKCQPFWNDDLASLWRSTCQAEKDYTVFRMKSCANYKTILDKRFRYYKHKNWNTTDRWSKHKEVNNPPSSRAALEIVCADESISRDIKEILERWHADISKLFSRIKENPERVFGD